MRLRAAQGQFFALLERAQSDSAPADAAADFGGAIKAWTPAEGKTLLAACYFGRAQSEYSLGRLAESAADASRSLKFDSGNWRAGLVRGRARLAEGLYRESATDFERIIQLQPDNGEAYLYLGQAQLGMGWPLEAYANLKKAAALKSADYRPFLVLAALWRMRGRCDQAVPLYEKAEALSGSTLVRVQAGIGACERQGKHFRKALGYYDRAVESGEVALGDLIRGKAPTFKKNESQHDLASAYFGRGLDYEDLEKPQSARADYEKACSLGYDPACDLGAVAKIKKGVGPVKKRKKKVIYSGFQNSPGTRIYAP